MEQEEAPSIPVDKEEKRNLLYKGLAHLCFFFSPDDEHKSSILGHFIVNQGNAIYFSISGVEKTEGKQRCICTVEKQDRWYDLTITDTKNYKEITTEVMKTGGDNTTVFSPYIYFVTESFKVDQDAIDHVNRFVRKGDFSQYGVIVCLGQMEIYNLNFDKLKPGDIIEKPIDVHKDHICYYLDHPPQ